MRSKPQSPFSSLRTPGRLLAGVLLIVSLSLSGCGQGKRSEVRTNNGGILDCPSATIEYASYSYGDDAGSPTPEEAISLVESEPTFPSGTPQIETEQDNSVVYVFTDGGNRLGRALLVELNNGWVVEWTERCG